MAGLVAELQRRGLSVGARVLLPVPLVTGGLQEPPVLPHLISALRRIGCWPVCVPAFQTTPGLPGPGAMDACGAERELLMSGKIAAIIFASKAEAQGLCRLMGGREALVGAIREHGIVLAAHGPHTAVGASDTLGVPVSVMSKRLPTFEGVVEALAEAIHGPVDYADLSVDGGERAAVPVNSKADVIAHP